MSKALAVVSDNIHLKPKRDLLAFITDKASGGSGTAEPRALSSLVSPSYGSSLPLSPSFSSTLSHSTSPSISAFQTRRWRPQEGSLHPTVPGSRLLLPGPLERDALGAVFQGRC